MDSDRTPPAQLAAGGATVPAGAGYAPSHQDDHDTDGGHDPAGKFVSAVNRYLASMKFKRDLGNVQATGLADNMPPPPPNIVTDWYAKSEEGRKANPGREKKSSGDAPPLHPVMIALIMQEARKKAEAAGKTAAGVLGADVVIEGRPDLDERSPKKKGTITKEAWAPGMSGTLDMGSYFRSSGGSRSAADTRVAELNNGKVGNVVPDTIKSVEDSVGNAILDYGTSFVAKRLGMSEEELKADLKTYSEMGAEAKKQWAWYLKNKDTIDMLKNVVGWLGKDGLGLGGKNWHYALGGIGALGLGYAGYKMMGSDNAPSNAHAAQQRGAAPRDPHSSEYEDMMLDMMMRRRQQY